MGENEFNQNPLPDDSIASFFKTGEFGNLSEENKKIILDKLPDKRTGDGGWLGKLFGNKKENQAMNIAFTICVLLIIVGLILTALGKDFWNIILTGIMTTVGYIFGRGGKE